MHPFDEGLLWILAVPLSGSTVWTGQCTPRNPDRSWGSFEAGLRALVSRHAIAVFSRARVEWPFYVPAGANVLGLKTTCRKKLVGFPRQSQSQPLKGF